MASRFSILFHNLKTQRQVGGPSMKEGMPCSTSLMFGNNTREIWIPPQKDTPHPRAKEKPQQDSRRGEIAFRIKPFTHQRHSVGSNKPPAHQDPEAPQKMSQNCVSVSCGGTGQQWPTPGTGALGAANWVRHKPSRGGHH